MSPLALSLVIVAAFLHATWNLAAKSSKIRPGFMFLSSISVAVLWGPAAIGLYFYSPQASPLNWTSAQWLCLLISSLVHLVYFYVLLEGYRLAPLSVVYPVARGLGPLFSSIGSVLFLHEQLSPIGISGIVGMVLGILLMSYQPSSAQVKQTDVFVGIGYGVAIGLTIAFYTLIDGYGVKHLGMHPLYYEYVGALVRGVLLLPSARVGVGQLTQMFRSNVTPLLTVSILGPGAYILVLTAMQLAPIGHVAPAREISLLIGTLLGGTFLAEGHTMRRLFAATLIATGVILLSW